MILTGLFGLLLIGVIIAHMTRPRFELREMSAARFFKNLPPAKQKNNRLKPSNPLKSLPLYLQFPLLALFLWANLSSNVLNPASTKADQVGLWIMLDTSASMSTIAGGKSNLERAQAALKQAVELSRNQAGASKARICARLSAFDLARRDVIPPTADLNAVTAAAEKLPFRPLGTDLTLIQQLLDNPDGGEAQDTPEQAACPITHMLVLTDMPAPEWVSREQFVRLVWLDIGAVVENSGMVSIQAARDPIVGKVNQITIELAHYGPTEPARTLQITGPDGKAFAEIPVEWGGNQAGRGTFIPTSSGLYHINILPEDAYQFDDQAVINITSGEQLRVDWQLPDRALFDLLPWQQESQNPDLRIVQAGATLKEDDQTPTLIVGPGYVSPGPSTEEIVYFLEGHPLIKDLNLDVAEQVGSARQPSPDGFLPVMASAEYAWAAYRTSPLAAYVPGLPQGDENLRAFSTTLFFNGVRFLVQSAPQLPLYTLTSPEQPEPAGNRVALHEEEGNTARAALSQGDISELRPTVLEIRKEPVWSVWVAAAVFLLLVERLLFVFGGERWR